MTCAKCGKDSPEGTSFCPACGKRLVQFGKRFPKWLSILVAMIALVGVSATTWWLARRTSYPGGNTPISGQTNPNESKPSPYFDPAATNGSGASTVATLTPSEIFQRSAPSVVTLIRYDADNNPTAQGSGFLIANSTIATNYHVIRGAITMTAQFADGSHQNVEGVLGYDPGEDVAVLRIDPVSTSPLPLGDASTVAVGDPVVAIGSPKGLNNTLSEGIISGKRSNRLQSTAAISPGSSGGPLLNMRGEVIGLNTSQFRGDGVEALNFAIPVNWASAFLGNATTTPLAAITQQQEVSKAFGPFEFQLKAHQVQATRFSTPENASNVQLDANFASSGGFGGHLRVKILQNDQPIYDSGDSVNAQFSLKMTQGDYILVVENTAMMLPREVTVQGKFSAVR